jgi:dTMP kinase
MEGVGGKFIVIEGTDGSGKTVQFERFILAIPEGIKFGTLDFPRYSEPSSYFVQKYLKGTYGGDIGPHAAAIFYALDRFDARLKVKQWFDEERLVIANRYVASNMAYQGAKFENREDREEFYRWLYNLEYDVLGVPKPDLNIVLHVPAEVAETLITKRGGKRDIHEADLDYQKRAEEAYLDIAKLFPDDFTVIECAPGGKLLSIDEIHKKVWAAAQKALKI